MITTEQILTSPAGFGLDTATPVQRARCRIGDGLPLGELRSNPDVLSMVGGPDALEALPSERGIAPDMVVDLSSIRSAKTMMACARAARATQAIDLSGLKRGEVPRIPLFSLKLDRAKVSFRMLSALFTESPALKPLVLDSTSESLLIRHPSGRPVEMVCAAGGRAAPSFVGDWFGGVIGDEAPRMIGREDGVTNLDDVLTASRGRLLPGAQIQLIGSPWAPSGPVYELVQEHFGKPTANIVVLRSTGPQNNPKHFTPEFCEKLQTVDPVAYQVDVLGEFADPESGLLNPIAVRRATREEPLELPPGRGRYFAAVDPSEGAAGSNGFALAIVERVSKDDDEDAEIKIRVALAREWRGADPETIWREIAAVCKTYGLSTAGTDQYAAAANAALARRHGLTLDKEPVTASSKVEDWTSFATRVHTNAIEFPPDRVLRRDLLSIRKRATQTGYQIVLPRTSDGRHCDLAAAVCSAVSRAAEPKIDWAGAMVLYGPDDIYRGRGRFGGDPWSWR